MTVALLWMLLTVSDGDHNRGNTYVAGYFVKQSECEKIKADIVRLGGNFQHVVATCSQAEVVVVK